MKTAFASVKTVQFLLRNVKIVKTQKVYSMVVKMRRSIYLLAAMNRNYLFQDNNQHSLVTNIRKKVQSKIVNNTNRRMNGKDDT